MRFQFQLGLGAVGLTCGANGPEGSSLREDKHDVESKHAVIISRFGKLMTRSFFNWKNVSVTVFTRYVVDQ